MQTRNGLVCLFFGAFLLAGSPQLQGQPDELYGKIVKEIQVSGAHFTDIDIITRELVSRVGEPYTAEAARKNFARLDNLDIFSYIRITPVAEDEGVVLKIEVKEIFPYLPFFSYEITDENGFAAGPGFQSVNFNGRDIFVTASARFGGATNITLFLENPWVAGNHLSYTLELFRRERFNELNDFNEIATELDLKIGSYLGEYGRIGGRFSFIDIESDSAGRTLSADNRDRLATFGFFVGYDSRDLWANPHRGWWNEFEISRTGFPFGDGDYWSFVIDIRRYIPLLPRHTLGLFSLATLRTGEINEEIPLYQRFHLGGTNSVRGWELDSRRGKNQLINTAEYRITLMQPKLFELAGLSADIGLQLALFGDLGVAWNRSGELQRENFIGGYGFGLRFLVPFVNMFRIDFGFGEPGESFMLHLGAFEKPVAQRFRVR